MKELTLGSLFDGIGGFPLAASRYGINTLWASEIEPFPIKVTKIRFPDMKHLGDIAKINGAEIDPVDIITFGSPCQDLSVAGKRAGLAGERSGLFMEAVRIIKEMRNTYAGTNEPIQPRFAVWENVPGAFSSNKGEDFRAVLEEICRVKDETAIIPGHPKGKWSTIGTIMGNGYSIAWRVLDAQYWGVPQRRRRIFLVADFGGQSAPEILFKREGLSRHLAESGEARERITADAERSTPKTMLIRCGCRGGGKGPLIQDNKSATLSCANIQTLFAPTDTILFEPRSQDGVPRIHGDICPTLNTAQGGQRQPCICLQGSMIGRADKNGPQGDGVNEDVSFTLNTTDRHAVAYGVVSKGNGEAWVTPERHMALNTGGGQAGQGYPAVLTQEPKVYGICSYASNSMKSSNPHSGIYEAETSRTIDLNGGSPACNQGGMAIVQVLNDQGGSQMSVSNDVVGTLRAEMHGNVPITCASKQYSQNVNFDMAAPLCAEDYKEPQVVATYQKVTGPLMANPGSYTGQDAHSDMLVTPVYGIDCRNATEDEELTHTLQAKNSGGFSYNCTPSVRQRYSVRRLTPLECERLQGFPDGWTDIPGQTEASKEELEFWRDVWLTWDKTQAEDPENVKPRTDKAILKWLKNPVSDSAQYKGLGNSVAVPCPEYVMEGISEILDRENQN